MEQKDDSHMKHLSIIVPMYNVEAYLERCIRSIEHQDIPQHSYEIICINDGSPDNSRDIIFRLQKEYDNIILIDQENQGVSRARNNGIEKATGRYLLFIDPDDYADTNSFGRILDNAIANNAQVSFLGFTFRRVDGTIRRKVFNVQFRKEIISGIEMYFLSRGGNQPDPDRMWAVLFETEFINSRELRFLPDVPFLEDGEFIARILCLAECCIFDGYSFYQRTTRPGSATNSNLYKSSKATSGFLLSAVNLRRFQKEQELSQEQRDFLNHPILKFLLLALDSAFNMKQPKLLISTVRRMRGLNFTNVCLDGCRHNYRIHGRLFNLSPYLGAFSHHIEPKIESLQGRFSRLRWRK